MVLVFCHINGIVIQLVLWAGVPAHMFSQHCPFPNPLSIAVHIPVVTHKHSRFCDLQVVLWNAPNSVPQQEEFTQNMESFRVLFPGGWQLEGEVKSICELL